MAWVYLFVAAMFEVGWAVGLKTTEGFTRFWPSVLTIAAMVISMLLLSLAVRTIPIGTGYAIWTGVGTIGAVLFGVAFFGEPTTPAKSLFLLMIVIGIVGLKLSAD